MAKTPIDIAREALKNLVQNKTPPTPDHYRKAYEDIVGTKSEDVTQMLVRLMKEAGRSRPKFAKMSLQLQQSAAQSNWKEVEQELRQLFPANEVTDVPRMGEVVRELIRELEISRPGVSVSRKREGLDRVLTNFGSDAEVLAGKIQGLVTSWKSAGNSDDMPLTDKATEAVIADQATVPVKTAAPMVKVSATAALWRDLLIRALEFGLMSQLKLHPELSKLAEGLLAQAKVAGTETEITKLGSDLKSFWFKLEMVSDEQFRLQEELVQLLRLLVDNMSELVVDDQWLQGQTAIIRDIISKPLNIDVLYDTESSLKELIYKQGQLKHGVIEARHALKQMASSFVERLAEMTEHAGEYHQKIEEYHQKIGRTEDMSELGVILGNLMTDTKAMQVDALRAYDDLKETQTKVAEAEARIQQLTEEIEKVSLSAQQDYLTGTLNRRGMDNAFERELARADRTESALSVALLDIDHFKKLNDSLGHDAGDVALAHLAKVVKDTLRPTDLLARFGGEEFVIIMPETAQEESIKVMTRVQRELTKNFFLHDNERVLITFSAGVAEREGNEGQDGLIKRADEALYRAKQAGRNRVFGSKET